MRRDDFHGVRLNCLMCPNPIPEGRPKNAVTCSKECTTARRNYWLSKQDSKTCRYCYKPSTPEQRALFQQWRRRPQNADEEEQFRLWREDQVKKATIDTRRANKKAKVEEPAEEESIDA